MTWCVLTWVPNHVSLFLAWDQCGECCGRTLGVVAAYVKGPEKWNFGKIAYDYVPCMPWYVLTWVLNNVSLFLAWDQCGNAAAEHTEYSGGRNKVDILTGIAVFRELLHRWASQSFPDQTASTMRRHGLRLAPHLITKNLRSSFIKSNCNCGWGKDEPTISSCL
jgi:hypothetical protein